MLPGPIAQPVGIPTADPGVAIQSWPSHNLYASPGKSLSTSMRNSAFPRAEIDHEIISMVILLLPLI